MKRLFILFSLCMALIVPSTTCVLAAGPPIQTLKGDFATIGTISCVQANSGGDFGSGPQFPLTSNGSTRVYQSSGRLSLFGDGTGSFSGKYMAINNGQVTSGDTPISGWTIDCDVTYASNPDGTFTITYSNCSGPLTAGPLAGGTAGNYFTVETGTVSLDLNTLLIADIEPVVETTWNIYENVTSEYKRICSRTAVAVRLRR
jgi:hypothetical protein